MTLHRLRHRQHRYLNDCIPEVGLGQGVHYSWARQRTCTHTYTHKETHMYTNEETHTETQLHTETHKHRHVYTHTERRTHTDIHTHTQVCCSPVKHLLGWQGPLSPPNVPCHHLEPQWYLGPLGCHTVPGIPWRARIKDIQCMSTPSPGISRPSETLGSATSEHVPQN